jgi:hypothetical protein
MHALKNILVAVTNLASVYRLYYAVIQSVEIRGIACRPPAALLKSG